MATENEVYKDDKEYYYDSINLEITNNWYIKSDKKGGDPTKHSHQVGSIMLKEVYADPDRIHKLVVAIKDIIENDYADGVNEIVLTTKISDEFN